MVKAFDVSKFRKNITKNISGMSIGFNDPTDWISLGNYALNRRLSGDFNKGIPLGKVTVIAGESGAGKSYIASGNLIKNAQAQGIFVVLIDTENALDESWLQALGVDTGEDKLLKLNMAMIDDVAKVISDFVKDYRADYADVPNDARPKVLFIIDSLGMLLTPTDIAQFEKGEMKGDMGRKPRQLKALVTNCVNMFGDLNIGLVATQHTYQSQDMFDPDDKISGGQGFIYASSMVIAIKKLKLKEDESGTKTKEVHGIRAKCKIMKTRYAKPFEEVEIQIPYDTGMSPYSGLFEFFDHEGAFTKVGNKYEYISPVTGVVVKEFEKGWKSNKFNILDMVMAEFDLVENRRAVASDNQEDAVIDNSTE